MLNFRKRRVLVTHGGSFHADDVFACAALKMVFPRPKIIRTYDAETIKTGDIVFDVGGEYNPARNRFDHHQPGGAGARENGIQYAAFGLVWRKFGEELAGSTRAAELVEKRLVVPIDAGDNGIDLGKPIFRGLTSYLIQDIINSFLPTWREKENQDEIFSKLINWAREILKREITMAVDFLVAEDIFKTAYQKSEDKHLIILDQYFTREEFNTGFEIFPETLFVVLPRKEGSWKVEGLRQLGSRFDYRKNFPSTWAGLRDEELARVSGVPDAVFCHRGLFMAVAKSKEGAIALAEKACS